MNILTAVGLFLVVVGAVGLVVNEVVHWSTRDE